MEQILVVKKIYFSCRIIRSSELFIYTRNNENLYRTSGASFLDYYLNSEESYTASFNDYSVPTFISIPFIFDHRKFIWRFEIPHSEFFTSIVTYYTWCSAHKISNMFDTLQVAWRMNWMAPHTSKTWHLSMYGGLQDTRSTTVLIFLWTIYIFASCVPIINYYSLKSSSVF